MRFQPVMSLKDNHPGGLEGLLTWEDPQRGSRPPTPLMGVAERHGLMPRLIAAQAEQTCGLISRLAPRTSRGNEMFVSMSIAMKYLSDAAVADGVVAAVLRTGIDPSRLVVELTEVAMLARRPQVRAAAQTLRNAGVRLSLGRFGDDFSSLTALRDLPVDMLTIDGTFVAGLAPGSDDLAIVSGGVGLAHELGLLCIADGVGNRDQVRALASAGCDLGQGPHWGPAITEAQAEPFLTELSTPVV